MSTRVKVPDERLRKKAAPLRSARAAHARAWPAQTLPGSRELDGRPLFYVERDNRHMVFGALPHFTRRSVGFTSVSVTAGRT